MHKTIIIIVGALIRLLTFALGAYLIYYGVDLLISGTAETIPFVSISPDGVEGRELPVAAFVSVIGLCLVALSISMKAKVYVPVDTGPGFIEFDKKV